MAGLFPLGRIDIRPQAARVMGMLEVNPATLLLRHVTGDWGDVGAEQRRTNDEAVREGGRILSAYGTGTRRLWVQTEADHSVTTVLSAEDWSL